MWSALLLSWLLTSPSPGLQSQSVNDEFKALEEILFRGVHDKDAEVLEGLLAEDYVLRGSPDVDRATWMANALDLCWGDRFDIDGVVVRQQDTMAVVSFVVVFYEDPVTCRPATLHSLITDVWILRDGNWRLTARQSGPANAANVTQQFAAVPEPPPTMDARGELSFVGTGGNASTDTLGLSSEVTHRGTGTTTGRVAFVRSEADDVENARSLLLRGRYGRRLSPRLEAFGRGEYLRDVFAGVQHRTTADAGVRVALSGRPHLVSVDAALGATSEIRLRAADNTFVNATTGLDYRWTVTPLTEVTATSSLVADLARGANWRATAELSLLAALNNTLSARLSYALRFVNDPVPGFKQSDRIVSAALVVRYRRPAR